MTRAKYILYHLQLYIGLMSFPGQPIKILLLTALIIVEKIKDLKFMLG